MKRMIRKKVKNVNKICFTLFHYLDCADVDGVDGGEDLVLAPHAAEVQAHEGDVLGPEDAGGVDVDDLLDHLPLGALYLLGGHLQAAQGGGGRGGSLGGGKISQHRTAQTNISRTIDLTGKEVMQGFHPFRFLCQWSVLHQVLETVGVSDERSNREVSLSIVMAPDLGLDDQSWVRSKA